GPAAAHSLGTDSRVDWGADWRADSELKGANDGNTEAHFLGTHLRCIDRFELNATFLDSPGAKEDRQERRARGGRLYQRRPDAGTRRVEPHSSYLRRGDPPNTGQGEGGR